MRQSRQFDRNADYRQRGWRTLLFAAVAILVGCTADSPGNAENAEEEQFRQLNIIEPIGQRSPYGNYLAGRFAERRKDFDQAATALGRALEDDPDNIPLARRTFYLALQAGQMDTALRLARRLDEIGANVSTTKMLLAAEAVRRGEYQAAQTRLMSMERSDLARYSVPLSLAWARVGAGDHDGALAALADLDRESGFTVLRRLHEGLIFEKAGRIPAARSAFESALGGNASTAPSRIVRAYGVFLERQGLAEEARQLYEAVTTAGQDNLVMEAALQRLAGGETPPPLVGNPAEGMAEGLFDIASILPRDRAGEVVLVYLRLALYLRPDFPLAQLLLADIYDDFERYEEAVEIYRGIDPNDPYGWTARLRLAEDLYSLGDADGAIRLLERLADERKDRSDALIRLGNILRYEERYGESVSAYDRALERIGALDRDQWVYLYSRGISLERAGKWERAELDFLKALEMEPNQPLVLNYLGYSWVEQGKNLERARQMLESAVAQRQEDGYIIDSMGWALYKLGDYAAAVRYLERAVSLRPQDPVINDHLGDAYWRVGRRSESQIQWQRVLGLEPEDDLREEILRKLDEGLPPAGNNG